MLTIDKTLSHGNLRRNDPNVVKDAVKLPILTTIFSSRESVLLKNPDAYRSERGFIATNLKDVGLSEPILNHLMTAATVTVQDVRVSNENLAFLTVLKKAHEVSHLYLIAYNITEKLYCGMSSLISKPTYKIEENKKNVEKIEHRCEGIQDSFIDLTTDSKIVKVFTKSQAFGGSVVYDEITLRFPYTDGSYDTSDEKEESIVKPLPVSTANPSTPISSSSISTQTRRPVARQNLGQPRPIRSMNNRSRNLLRIAVVVCVAILAFALFKKIH